MKYKALILDVDGTLVNRKKEITPETKKAIMQIQEMGVHVTIASGRPKNGLKELAEELELKRFGGYLIALNGGCIISCSDDRTVCQMNYSPQYIPQLYNLAKENKLCIMSYDDEVVITENPEDKYLQLEAKINNLEVKKIDDFCNYINFSVPKCIITGDGEHLAEVEPIIKKAVGKHLNVFRSEPFFLEILPYGVDKAYGITELSKIINIPLEEIAVCGDGYNDISMIKCAGLGVAMANAHDEVKEAADYITLSNEDDGIVYVIEKFFK